MKPSWANIDAARIGDTVESLKSMLVRPTTEALSQLRAMLAGGITFRDNFKCAIIERDLVHAVETPITLGFKPIGVYALRSEALGTYSRYAIDSLDWRLDAPGGTIGVKAKYDLNHTGPSLIKYHSTTEAIAHGAPLRDVVSWDSTERADSTGVITEATGIFTVSEAGLYHVSIMLSFQTGVTYTEIAALISQGTASYMGETYIPAALSNGPTITCTALLSLAAGGTFKAVAYQVNAAVAARNLIGGRDSGKKIQIARLRNDAVPTNTVTLLCVGG